LWTPPNDAYKIFVVEHQFTNIQRFCPTSSLDKKNLKLEKLWMKQCKRPLKLQETNPFPHGLCYVVCKGKKNTTREVLKIVAWPI
jgi:hypothetical protein